MKWLIIGALALLLFGCIGGQQKAPPASGLGDSDISPQDGKDENLVPSDDLIPPPDDGAQAGSTQVSVGGSISASDVDVVEYADDDLISEEDVIEPY